LKEYPHWVCWGVEKRDGKDTKVPYSPVFTKVNQSSYGGKAKADDSATWGNVLIGLNHILNEFIDKEDKIDVLQTKNTEIVVKYETDYGYAIVLITNQKNKILEKLIDDFSIEFKNRYMDELNDIQDLNRIIDLTEFTDTKGIVERNFKLYL